MTGILGTTLTQTEVVATSTNGFVTTSFWTADTGELKLALEGSYLDVDVTYSYTFVADNQPTSNPAQDVTFTNPSTFQTVTTGVFGSAQTGFGFMEIEALAMNVSSSHAHGLLIL